MHMFGSDARSDASDLSGACTTNSVHSGASPSVGEMGEVGFWGLGGGYSPDPKMLVRERQQEQVFARGDSLMASGQSYQSLNQYNLSVHQGRLVPLPVQQQQQQQQQQVVVPGAPRFVQQPYFSSQPGGSEEGYGRTMPGGVRLGAYLQHQHQAQQQKNGMRQQSLLGSKKGPRTPIYSDNVLVDLYSLEDASFEDIIVKSCKAILREAPRNTLKAVELANFLRSRVGSDVLARIREKWGGLLVLLERHTTRFRVDRIPKNDMVSLISSSDSLSSIQPTAAYPPNGGVPTAFSSSSAAASQQAPLAHVFQHGQQTNQIVSQHQNVVWVSTAPLTEEFPGSSTSTGNLQSLNRSDGCGSSIGSSAASTSTTVTKNLVVGRGKPPGSMQGLVLDAENRSMDIFIGNLPTNRSNEQFVDEFSRYGEIEELSSFHENGTCGVVIKFATIEQSVGAKQRISKLPQFVGHVMFAHPQGQVMQQQQQHHQQQLQQKNSPIFVPGISAQHFAAASSAAGGGDSPMAFAPFEGPPGFHANSFSLTALDSIRPVLDGSANSSGLQFSRPVINRLVDSMFSFTDKWIADPVLDSPYVSLLVSELQDGRCCSLFHLASIIPNVTGLEINMLALKAMCLSYPQSFQVRGIQVALPSIDMSPTRTSAWF